MTCGEGTRNSTRTHKVAAKFGGDECDGSTSAIKNCKEKECPGRITNLVSHAYNGAFYYVIEFLSSNHQFCSSLCME